MTESSKRDDLQSKFLKYKKTGEEKDVVLKFFLHEFPREEIYGQRRGKATSFPCFEMGCYAFSILLMTSFTSRSSFRLPAQRVGLQRHPFPLLHQTLDWYHGFLRSV